MTKALICDGKVIELSENGFAVASGLMFVDTNGAEVAVGWKYDGVTFSPPSAVSDMRRDAVAQSHDPMGRGIEKSEAGGKGKVKKKKKRKQKKTSST